jgi:hypothetical protein
MPCAGVRSSCCERERPHLGGSYRCGISLEDAADRHTISQHVEIVITPLAGCCCGRQSVGHRDDRRHDGERCSRHLRICRKGSEGLPKRRAPIDSGETFSLAANISASGSCGPPSCSICSLTCLKSKIRPTTWPLHSADISAGKFGPPPRRCSLSRLKPRSIRLFKNARRAHSYWLMPEGPIRRDHRSHAGRSRCTRRAARNAETVTSIDGL